MREPTAEESSPAADLSNDWGIAVAIALTIFICLAAFVCIFIELEPFMNDFTGSDVVVTPDPTDPSASPVEGIDSDSP